MRALKLLHLNSVFILLAFSASCLLAQNTDDLTQPYTMDDNTVVLLHLDDDLANASDSTADGTGFGNLLYLDNNELGTEGEFGKYLYLDNDAGSDSSFIEIPDTAALDLQGSWTIEGWINVLSVGVSTEDWHTYPKMAKKGLNYWVGANGDLGSRNFQAEYADDDGFRSVQTPDQTFELTTWYHLSSIHDAENGIFMVAVHDVNGDLVTFNNIVYDFQSYRVNDDPLTIGFAHDWTDAALNGLVDEFRISNVVRQFPMPPVIKRLSDENELVTHLDPLEDLTVGIDVVSSSGTLTDVTLYYSTGGDFSEIAMTAGTGSSYSAVIPGQAEGTEVRYYIAAENSYGFSANSQKSLESDSGAYYGITYGMENSLILHMDFEQSLYDSSSFHHTVVDSFGDVKYSDVAKFGNYSVQMDSSYILKVEKPASYFSSDDMTIDLWMYPDSIFQNEVVMSRWQEWAVDDFDWRFSYRLWWNNWDGRFMIELFTNEQNWAQVFINYTMEVDNWYHVIVKYSTANGQCILELRDSNDDLLEETVASLPGGIKRRAGEVVIGGDRMEYMLPSHFVGKIDNLKMYNYAADLPPAVRRFDEPPVKHVVPAQEVTISTDIENAVSAILYSSINGAEFVETAMTKSGDMTFSSAIPGQDIGTVVQYYIMAENESGREVRVPGSGNNTLGFSEANDLTFSLDFEEGSGVPGDKSGYGSEVTIFGNPQYVTDAATGTYALQYNDSSYLQVRPPAPFLVNGQVTVEVSFKALELPDNSDVDLISKYSDPEGTWRFGYRISFQPEGKIRNEIHLFANDPGEGNWEWNDVWLDNDYRIVANEWYHYVLDIGSDSAYVSLYDADHNLMDKASMNISGQRLNQVSGPFTLGRSWWGGAPALNALFDDVNIYNYSKKETDPTAIEDDMVNAIPTKFSLEQNFPNPFNPSTEIRFSIPETNIVELKVFNILGQQVRTLLSKEMSVGYHKITWDGKNDVGTQLSTGIYYYRVKAGDYVNVKKMILIK